MRYTGAKHKICRKEGIALCGLEKCPVKKGKAAPGQHGFKRKRLSDFGKQLKEKQKLKAIYGIVEKQFRNYYDEAIKRKGVTAEILLRMLELRLDNVVYRLGVGASRPHARQLVRHGKVMVNGRVTDIPSFRLSPGDEISFDKKIDVKREVDEFPSFLKFNAEERRARVAGEPRRDDIELSVDEQLIVEYYSR